MLPETVRAPFQLHLPGFDGSMPALLDLVGERKVSIDELPLAEVTEQFCAYLATVDAVDLAGAGDFLAAAARLMLMKSKVLLPQPTPVPEDVVEAPGTDQVQIDREDLREAALLLGARQGVESFPPSTRPEWMKRPIEPCSPSLLRRAWEDMRRRMGAELIRVATPPFVRLEVALSRLIRDLASATKLSLQHILRGSSRNDAAVHFVAVLELVRLRQAAAEQHELFGEITLERVDTALGARFRAV